jgi:hypothetical protein
MIRLGKLWKVIVRIMGIIFINLKAEEYACKDCGEEVIFSEQLHFQVFMDLNMHCMFTTLELNFHMLGLRLPIFVLIIHLTSTSMLFLFNATIFASFLLIIFKSTSNLFIFEILSS